MGEVGGLKNTFLLKTFFSPSDYYHSLKWSV